PDRGRGRRTAVPGAGGPARLDAGRRARRARSLIAGSGAPPGGRFHDAWRAGLLRRACPGGAPRLAAGLGALRRDARPPARALAALVPAPVHGPAAPIGPLRLRGAGPVRA